MIRAKVVAALVAATLVTPPVVVRDAGPGPTGRYLAEVLARPDTRVIVADTLALPADSTFAGSLVVIGRQLTIASTVQGDVIVVGGFLIVHPGAKIGGKTIAIGGGVYPSMLAQVRGGSESHRDFTFDTSTVGRTIELRYREIEPAPTSVLDLPGISGLRIPSYDRSNGLSIPYGPTLRPTASVTIDPVATYRSEIGRVDPTLGAEWKPDRRFWIHGLAGRDTRSNDGWITSDLSNSLNALFLGRDIRNWYRATGGNLFANQLFETTTLTSHYRLGVQYERARSARPDSFPTVGPWSFIGRKSDEGMRRINPQIAGGDITSLLGGVTYVWSHSRMTATLDVTGEVPTSVSTGGHFTQLTIDGQFTTPTFGTQRYRFDSHAILTGGDAPAQRFGYLGGPGTLSTIEPALTIGGDQLLFFENRYDIPLSLRLPFVGSPTVTLRDILGAAGVQSLPALRQLIGLRVSILVFRAELLRDLRSGLTDTHFSLSLVR